jgi:biopolymer transport protein ExbB/TolQ
MKKYPMEFIFQVVSLLVAFLAIHPLYVVFVRPTAYAILAEQAAAMRVDPNYIQERSFWVVIKDYEQESEIILMLWALAIMSYKSVSASRARRVLQDDLVPLTEGMKILPEDAREFTRQIQSLPPDKRESLLSRTLLTALRRFTATRSIQDASSTAHSVAAAESERLDSELSMVRYILWAIPSIGFIGTVRGIGDALSQAHKAVEGDLSGVTESLGVAFNSTLIALLICLVLMFILHQLQLSQERLVLDTERYLDEHLIQHLQVPS